MLFVENAELPFFAADLVPRPRRLPDELVEIESRHLRPVRIAAHGPEDFLQSFGHRAEGTADFEKHSGLIAGQSIGFDATGQQIVGADQQVLDVVGIRPGHDADAGVELGLHFERRFLRFIGPFLQRRGVELLLQQFPVEFVACPLGVLLADANF